MITDAMMRRAIEAHDFSASSINETRFRAALEAVSGDLIAMGMEKAADLQPSTAENPNESAYQRGFFDGIIEFGTAIRAAAQQAREAKG